MNTSQVIEAMGPLTVRPSSGSIPKIAKNMMPPVSQFKRFDVRDLIGKGIEPFPEIRKRVGQLKPDEGLIVVAPFLPSPLIEWLGGEGFKSKVEHGPGAAWMVFFWREAPSVP